MTPRAKQANLADLIVTAPQLIDPEAPQARVAAWLAQVPATESAPLETLFVSHPIVSTLIKCLAESSPYLWEMASRDPARLLRPAAIKS